MPDEPDSRGGPHRAKGRVATVAIDAMKFLRPASDGDEVSCYCSLVETGEHSVMIKIETWARSRGEETAEKVTEDMFTFGAIDEKGKPRELPEQN